VASRIEENEDREEKQEELRGAKQQQQQQQQEGEGQEQEELFPAPRVQIYRWESILEATENFDPSNQISGAGAGAREGASCHFLASRLLSRHPVCVVKLLHGVSEDALVSSVARSSLLRHPHLLPFLGLSIDPTSGQAVLLLPFASRGSLQDHLLPQVPSCGSSTLRLHPSPPPPLSWTSRVRILAQVSDALRFLHSGGCVHGGLSSSSVLLSASSSCKLAQPSPCSLSALEQQRQRGLVDPLLALTASFEELNDAFDLGLLLLLCLTGLPLVDPSSSAEPLLLDRCGDLLAGREEAMGLADPRGEWREEEAEEIAKMAAALTSSRRARRATVEEAQGKLQELLLRQGLSWRGGEEEVRVCGFCWGDADIRFHCQHASCCRNCAGALMHAQQEMTCPACGKKVEGMTVMMRS